MGMSIPGAASWFLCYRDTVDAGDATSMDNTYTALSTGQCRLMMVANKSILAESD